jgi:type IV pilus assembly protein PilQ
MKLRGGLFQLLLSLPLLTGVAAASGTLQGIKTSVDAQGTTFLLQMPTPVQYTPSQVGPKVYLLDITGVSGDGNADSQPVQSPLVSGYRVFSYHGADSQPHLSLEITLREEADIRPTAVPDGLQIRVERPAGSPAVASAAPAPSTVASRAMTSALTQTSLREVSVIQPENRAGLEVEILGDGELSYQTLKLSKPDRLVVDLNNTVNRIRQTHLAVNAPPLKAVRIAQFRNDPPVARIVMDLDAQVPFEVRRQQNGLVISLAGSLPQNASNLPASLGIAVQSAEETKSAAKVDIPLASDLTPEDVAPITSSAQTPADAEPALIASLDPTVVAPPAPRTSLPATAPSFAMQAAPVQPALELAPAPPAGEPVLLAQQTPAAAPVMAAASSQQMAQPCMTGAYTGEPISLNLKDVDLKDFFRLMHEVSGLNVVLDPNVSGVVTVVLDEVPWDQAMDIVDRNNGLDCTRTGNVVRIAKVSTLEAEAKALLAKAQAEEQREKQGMPLETITRTLGYAKAADLVAPLKPFLSPRGNMVPDARTNTLIITDIATSLDKIGGLIGTLDRRTQQVEIEARIIAARRSFAREIGSQFAASGASGNVTLGGTGSVGVSPINRGTVPPLFVGSPPSEPGTFANLPQPLAVNLPTTAPTSGFTFLLSGGRFALDEIITAAETRGVGKLLSRPKIITQNNIEANVEQGVRIPIQTSVNNTITIQYVRVVLRLTVTPQITSEGTIFLKTDIENTSINAGIPRILGIPALDTQAATTNVLVSDGGTVFFGGIIQTNNSLQEDQVPLLGDIPLIGHLFRHKRTDAETNELLFFITPKITQS